MKKWILLIVSVYCALVLYRAELIPLPSLHKKSDDGKTHYASVRIGGQLGNQMFKIAMALAYAKDNDLHPLFPDLHQEEDQINYNRTHIFHRLDASASPTPLTLYFSENWNYSRIPNGLQDVIFDGALFSWKFFDHHRDYIRSQFAPSASLMEKLNCKYGDLIDHPRTVAVHVRTYSKPVHEKGLHFVGWKYFEKTLSQFPEDSLFVIFSDRIQFSKANFTKRFPTKKFVFIEGNDHIEDLFLMSMMKAQILSKSTFSFWAAYLNTTPSLTVYAPIENKAQWPQKVKNILKKLLFIKTLPWSDEEYLLPEWHTATYDIEPFPEDIYDYDDICTSVCPADQ